MVPDHGLPHLSVQWLLELVFPDMPDTDRHPEAINRRQRVPSEVARQVRHADLTCVSFGRVAHFPKLDIAALPSIPEPRARRGFELGGIRSD